MADRVRERIASSEAAGTIAAEHLDRLTTGVVADALRMLGLDGALAGIRPVPGSDDVRVVGPATTVAYGPVRPGSPRTSVYEAIRRSSPGGVLVIDGGGLPRNFAGDNMGETAKRRGLVAVVVNGGARDLAGYRAMGMPLYCTGAAVAPRPPNVEVIARDVPVDIGGVLIRPGDLIVADGDGVIAIPAERMKVVAETIALVLEAEEELETAIRGDAPLEAIAAALAKKKPRPIA